MDERVNLATALLSLVGEQLSSVVFVMDYVQLCFASRCLTVYCNAHQVTKAHVSISWGNPGYRDALCGLIAHKVKKTNVLSDESISFNFDDESVWSMSLRKEDYRGPEAFQFTDPQSKLWFVG
jgi:hypothetical protein